MSVQQTIENKLREALSPSHLEVINESHMHSVPPNSETHFKLVIVSDVFRGKRPVQRHQLVYSLLNDEREHGVHALAMHTYASDEWGVDRSVPASPNCMGGSK
ncbi:BolA family protein [Porticoccus sp.]